MMIRRGEICQRILHLNTHCSRSFVRHNFNWDIPRKLSVLRAVSSSGVSGRHIELLRNKTTHRPVSTSVPLFDLFLSAAMSRQLSTESGDPAEVSQKSSTGKEIYGVDFEVHGTVQGVFFRKYTQKRAMELGLVGYVRNTDSGSVVGRIEGLNDAVETMKDWLQHTGSPHSQIKKCVFTNVKKLDKVQLSDFKIRN